MSRLKQEVRSSVTTTWSLMKMTTVPNKGWVNSLTMQCLV